MGCTRSAKLARLAQLYGCPFERHKTSVTTAFSAGRLELFTQFFHQYRNVFTFTTSAAFTRLADDLIFLDDKPGTKPICITLFSAEMRNTQFPTLKIAPLTSPFAASQYTCVQTNVEQIDNIYRVHAPNQDAGLLFTPFVLTLFKTHPSVYLELNDNVLIYHEHTLVPPEGLEEFRLRAMQILDELQNTLAQRQKKYAPAAAPVQTPAAPSDTQADADVQQRAETLLHSLAPLRKPFVAPSHMPWRGVWVILLGALLLAIMFLPWYALHHWLGR